jgi:hypothetical protein
MQLPSEERFIDYYDLEQYLFGVVGPRFQLEGQLSSFDFFCIVIWKANRAKSRIAKRLLRSQASLDEAVRELTGQIAQAASGKGRLAVLMEGWGFRLPMASAILTVLYPEEFTIYDVRVCEALNNFAYLKNFTNPERRWEKYCAYCLAVQNSVGEPLSLRDKDRWLWGKSFFYQLQQDIQSGFATAAQPNSGA